MNRLSQISGLLLCGAILLCTGACSYEPLPIGDCSLSNVTDANLAALRAMDNDMTTLLPDNELANILRANTDIPTSSSSGKLRVDWDVWRSARGVEQGGNQIFKIGDEIAGIRIERIRPGTNGKYIVIGRSMDTRVAPAARAINAECWMGFNRALSEAENLANYRIWIRSKIANGYSVIDIGLDPNFVLKGDMSRGPYYSMELLEVFGIR